jgi:hypothetical protein
MPVDWIVFHLTLLTGELTSINLPAHRFKKQSKPQKEALLDLFFFFFGFFNNRLIKGFFKFVLL